MTAEPRKDTPRNTTTVNGIISPEETAKVAQDLVCGVRLLSSDQGYRALAELVDRIPDLERDVREKDRRLKKASEDSENRENAHAAELKKNLWLYGDETDRFRKEKASLERKIKELQTTLSEKETKIFGLEKRDEDLKIAGRKLEDAYKGRTSKLKEKESELASLAKQAKESQKEIENLSTTLKGAQSQASILKQSLDQCEQHNTRLTKELQTTHKELEELRGFSVPLQVTDPKVV
ncbi:hypothetical protein GQ44DRAFT_734260 [Phaeosphaeriaceae sp. PMI808]|nr:hypothetical protein GQ44DRAFT_734260 [Phaeosphaeriaceae sp. PMI808]